MAHPSFFLIHTQRRPPQQQLPAPCSTPELPCLLPILAIHTWLPPTFLYSPPSSTLTPPSTITTTTTFFMALSASLLQASSGDRAALFQRVIAPPPPCTFPSALSPRRRSPIQLPSVLRRLPSWSLLIHASILFLPPPLPFPFRSRADPSTVSYTFHLHSLP